MISHPDYDDFWKRQAWVKQLHNAPVPDLNVARFWDQEDPWGPWRIFESSAKNDPSETTTWLRDPGSMASGKRPKAVSIGSYDYGGHDTAKEFRRDIEASFFRYFLHGDGSRPAWRMKTFQSGSNTWHTYDKWPPAGSVATKYTRAIPARKREPTIAL